MSLQILYQRYTVTGHEKPWMAKLKVIFMKKSNQDKNQKIFYPPRISRMDA